MLSEYEAAGVSVFAVSANDKETATKTVEEWGLDKLRIGYGLDLVVADEWGLFLSAAAKDTEPAHFVEPGLFVVRPDGTLYASIVNTMPFARPPAKNFLGTLQWIIENDYPPRGEAQLGA